jgi:hypothetical protein
MPVQLNACLKPVLKEKEESEDSSLSFIQLVASPSKRQKLNNRCTNAKR